MDIRRATIADATAICDIVIRSIRELCIEDHKDDPDILALWLANKTPENVARWLETPANTNLVAIEGAFVLGAGCVTTAGEITLNYVSPDARFRGVSRALVAALEAAARQNGNRSCRLESTATARRFYQGAGYVDSRAPMQKHGLTTYPMSKDL